MSDKVKLGSIGLGWWGSVLAAAAASSGDAEVVSCFARTKEKREQFAQAHGCRAAGSLEELLGDPEVEGVLIATSHATHRELIEAAAEAGKHILVEKPLTIGVEDARACLDAAQRAGVQLQVGHQRRKTAANQRIKQMIDEGTLGDLEMVEGHHSISNGLKMPPEAWRWDEAQSPLGGMTSMGIHKLDSFIYLVGPIRSVFTYTRPGRAVSIDEGTALALEFESGVVGTLLTSFFSPRLSRLAVYGTGGAAFNESDGTRLLFQEIEAPGPSEVELEPVDPVVEQLAEFARVVRGEAVPEVGGREGLEIVAILQAAVESARTGRSVDVAAHRG